MMIEKREILSKDPKTINIRRATIMDLDSIIAVEKESFSTPWPRQAFVDELDRNIISYYIVMEQGSEVVGYMGMWIIVDEAHITNIAVHPKARRQQIAELAVRQMMLLAKERGALRMTLEVRKSNTAAIALYEKLNFVRSGLRRNYYTDPREDAIIMWVNL